MSGSGLLGITTCFCAVVSAVLLQPPGHENQNELLIGVVRQSSVYALERGKAEKSGLFLLNSELAFNKPDVITELTIWRVSLGKKAGNGLLSAKSKIGSRFAYPAQATHLRLQSADGFYIAHTGRDAKTGAQLNSFAKLDSALNDTKEEPPILRELRAPQPKAGFVVNRTSGGQLPRVGFGAYYDVFNNYWKLAAESNPATREAIQNWKLQALPDYDAGDAPPPLPSGAFIGFMPIKKDACLFFLVWGKQIRVWEESMDEHAVHFGKRSPDLSNHPLYSIPVQWAEPFAVYGKAPNFSIVTESGKLYTWRNAGKPQQELECQWESPAIEVVLQEADTDKAWAFTAAIKGKQNGSQYYFQLSPDDKKGLTSQTTYQLPKVTTIDLPARVRMLLPYAKVLAADKRIKLSKS